VNSIKDEETTLANRLQIPITRRLFVRLALVGAATTLVEAGCAGSSTATPAPPAPPSGPPADATPSATHPSGIAATPLPSPTPEAVPTFPPLTHNTPALLHNRNDPYYNVRYVKLFLPVDHVAWRLEVKGQVEAPGSFSLAELLDWPQDEQISRMKCVEFWSFKAKWGGFRYQTLAERVKPRPEATHVRFDCADEYWEFASLQELANPQVIFVLRMNDELLLDEYGAPLRMMFPAKYGYKSAKAVTTITFTDQGGEGYWPTVGGYSPEGDIASGFDYPQDQPYAGAKQIEGGEITTN
jgi:DMSO/TMAO reductase YedYZ molybdopterin-dependent catalytic subunit